MIHHINLVRLRGFCSEGNKRALVYDYMPNGSLDAYLFTNSPGSKVLSWGQRFGVAVGVARGLAYLHEKCRECIIHCDIKPENILLDEELGAKLADFGMAKLVGHEFSRVLTTMRGTMGYLAPEWLTGAPVTAKADVYSFGLLLFELVSGRRNNGSSGRVAAPPCTSRCTPRSSCTRATSSACWTRSWPGMPTWRSLRGSARSRAGASKMKKVTGRPWGSSCRSLKVLLTWDCRRSRQGFICWLR